MSEELGDEGETFSFEEEEERSYFPKELYSCEREVWIRDSIDERSRLKCRRGEERESLFGMEKRGKNPGSKELRKGCEGVTTWDELGRMGDVKGEVWKDLSREEIG